MDRKQAEELILLRNQLCFALVASSRLIVDAYGPILRPLGLTYDGYLVMMVLWEHGAMPEHEVAEKLQTDPETLAAWSDELQAEGFVRRDVRDGTPLLAATQSGQELREAVIDVVPDAIRCRLLLPEDDIGSIREGLYSMMSNIRATELRD